MKKTLTVNLGGTVFHIDEDAYQLLDKYLTNLRIHFKNEEETDEIMNDFEARISELLSERIRLGYEVITIEHIEEVIKRMGKPEDLFGDEQTKEEKEEQPTEEAYSQQATTTRRRLMRNPDDRILGGVCGGFAAYMNWDPTAVRIALFLLMFFFGVTIPLYFILWLIVPMAQTATEKLEMRGESVTIENIGKTVTNGFEKVSNKANEYINSDKPRTALQKMGDMFVVILGYFAKFILILMGIILLPVMVILLFALVMVTFGLLVGGAGFLYHFSPFGMDMMAGMPTSTAIMGCIGLILLIGVPVCSMIYALSVQAFKARPMSTAAKWVLLVLWFIGLALCAIYTQQMGSLAAWREMWSSLAPGNNLCVLTL